MKIGIVGGGVYGTAVAYFLKKLGTDEVILFERDHLGSGSTGYSAGIIRHHYSLVEQIRAAQRGREVLQNFEKYTGQDSAFHETGYLRLTSDNNESKFRDTLRKQKELGIDVEIVEPDELDEYMPMISSNEVSLGAYEYNAGFADPYLVTMGFAEAARDLGANLRTNEPVLELFKQSGEISEVKTNASSYSVDYVVNAAGPWGNEIASMVGIELPLQWYESKLAVLTAEESYDTNYPVVADHSTSPDMYTKPELSGNFLVGGIDRPQVDKETGGTGVKNNFLIEASYRIEQRFPGLSDVRVVDTWSGIITKTPDSHQIIGTSDKCPNLYNIVGNSGHGFKESPAFAEAIAEDLLGKSPSLDLSMYHLDRFGNNQPLTDEEQH